MAFNPGKDSGEQKKLRAILNNPRSPQAEREKARQILHATSPTLNQYDDIDPNESHNDAVNREAVEQLLDQATTFLGQFDTDKARVCVDEALQLAESSFPLRAAVLDIAVQILIQDHAPAEQIIQILNEAEMLSPQTSHERILDLAQFSTGEQCLKYYQNAITLIEKEIFTYQNELNKLPKNKTNQQQRQEMEYEMDDLKNVAATAMVAIGELYTTDLCDEDNAEQQCSHYLLLAIKTDPMNVEAYRSYGNFCFIRYDATQPNTNITNNNLLQEAIKYTKQAYQVLRQCYEQGLEDKIPEFTARLELGRQLYELECWEETLTVLTMLLQEELEVAEIWLFCIIASYKLAEQLQLQLNNLLTTTTPTTTPTTTTNTPNKKAQQQQYQITSLQDQIVSLLTCAAQYCVNCGRVLEAAEDKDEDIITQLKQYVALLKEKGYTLAQAKLQLNGGEVNLDDEETLNSILDSIDSDSDDDDDNTMGENTTTTTTNSGMGD